MASYLILTAGLKHTEGQMVPFAKNLKSLLEKSNKHVDIMSIEDEGNMDDYSHIIFVFPISVAPIGSPLMHFLKKTTFTHHQYIYTMAFSPLFEPDSTEAANKVIASWAKKQYLRYQGTLRIGSLDLIQELSLRLRVIAHIKRFANAIMKNEPFEEDVTVNNIHHFIRRTHLLFAYYIHKSQRSK